MCVQHKIPSTNKMRLCFPILPCKHNRSHCTLTQLINALSARKEQAWTVFVRCAGSLLFSPSSSFLHVFGERVCLPLPEVMYGIEEKFIPKKGEACWERSLHKAGRQAFEEASHALLSGYLKRAIHQASITPHLRVRNRRQCLKLQK